MMTKPKIREAIVVEGRYDKNTVSQTVDALILVTNGFQLYHDEKARREILQAAQRTGIVVLTDSDASGFQIRSCIKSFVPADRILHAYIPDVYGKEKRKDAPGKEGKLGVEGMGREVILNALRTAGATFLDEPSRASESRSPVTVADLYSAGLTGSPDSKEKRTRFLRENGLPEHLGTHSAAAALSRIMSREEFFRKAGEF